MAACVGVAATGWLLCTLAGQPFEPERRLPSMSVWKKLFSRLKQREKSAGFKTDQNVSELTDKSPLCKVICSLRCRVYLQPLTSSLLGASQKWCGAAGRRCNQRCVHETAAACRCGLTNTPHGTAKLVLTRLVLPSFVEIRGAFTHCFLSIIHPCLIEWNGTVALFGGLAVGTVRSPLPQPI